MRNCADSQYHPQRFKWAQKQETKHRKVCLPTHTHNCRVFLFLRQTFVFNHGGMKQLAAAVSLLFPDCKQSGAKIHCSEDWGPAVAVTVTHTQRKQGREGNPTVLADSRADEAAVTLACETLTPVTGSSVVDVVRNTQKN